MKCKICEKDFKKLGRHLKSKHGISSKEYYDRYLKKDGDGFCVVCGKSVKFTRISMGGYPKHCLSCVSKDPNVKKKKEKTCFDHYGTTNPMKSLDIKDKYKKNNLEKYGFEWPMQRPEIRDKSVESCLNKYGVENINQLESIQEKKEKTNLKNRGVRYPTQSKDVIKKSKKTCKRKYGVDHFFKSDDGRKIARENFIGLVEQQKLNGEPLTPRIGKHERQCLNELQNYSKYQIIRNVKLIGYFPDGYIEELNLIIEFDERHHFVDEWKTYCENDVQKDKDYQKYNLNIFRIKQKDWEQNKNTAIEKFQTLIGELI